VKQGTNACNRLKKGRSPPAIQPKSVRGAGRPRLDKRTRSEKKRLVRRKTQGGDEKPKTASSLREKKRETWEGV